MQEILSKIQLSIFWVWEATFFLDCRISEGKHVIDATAHLHTLVRRDIICGRIICVLFFLNKFDLKETFILISEDSVTEKHREYRILRYLVIFKSKGTLNDTLN